jgi:hypothetical protein
MTCRICGCTDFEACRTEEGPCYWVSENLCSECAETSEQLHEALDVGLEPDQIPPVGYVERLSGLVVPEKYGR